MNSKSNVSLDSIPSSRPTHSSTFPVSARESSPALDASLIHAKTILGNVESLGDATGAMNYKVGSIHVGAILVEHGRICWAVEKSLRKRLTDIIRHQTSPPLDAGAMEASYQACHEARRPLGEFLVEKGLVRPSGFRSALRQHSAEAIARIGKYDAKAEWHPHRKQTYDPTFTFVPAEILATIGMVQHLDDGTAARDILSRILLDEATGLAFRNDAEGKPQLVAYHGPLDLSVDAVENIAAWASEGLDVAKGIDGTSRIIATLSAEGQSLVAFSKAPLVFAIATQERSTFARVLGAATREL